MARANYVLHNSGSLTYDTCVKIAEDQYRMMEDWACGVEDVDGSTYHITNTSFADERGVSTTLIDTGAEFFEEYTE